MPVAAKAAEIGPCGPSVSDTNAPFVADERRVVQVLYNLLANAIGFDAPDEQPVNLLIFLLVPETATQKHLEILSEIAELLSDSQLRERLKHSDSQNALHDQISQWHSAQAA